jgi:hypothetical protein
MNLTKTLKQYNEDYIYFLDPIRNNIIDNGSFIKIIYSTPIVTFNGIYLHININYQNFEKYFNKFKCTFDVNLHKDTITMLKNIEENILIKLYNSTNKTPQYKIYEQLKNGTIKIFSNSCDKISPNFILKIAGIWETDTDYGLTYKFINII